MKGRVLVTGASGFVGRRLVQALVREKVEVRCLVRRLTAGLPGEVETVLGDLLRPESIKGAFRGVDTAYYLIHSLSTGKERFARDDRDAAFNFAGQAGREGVRRVIYLSGLGGPDSGLSAHLESRQEIADILRSGRFLTTVLRAAVIIGAGGASFELIRFLVKTQPVLPEFPWLDHRCQPIAVDDVIAYLVGCLREERTAGKTFDIGGPEVLTYRQILERFARVCGDVNLYVPVPFALPRLAARMVGFFSPVGANVAEALLDSLRNEVVCRNSGIRSLLPVELTPFDEAVRRAMGEKSRWANEGEAAARVR